MKTKNVYIIAGPNGSGKTTFAKTFLPDYAKCSNFINADLIALGLSPFSPEIAAVKAAQATSRPPDQFITVRQACSEKSLDYTAVVSGRQTADQYIGNLLSRAGCEKGGKQSIRAGDSSVMVPAQTYRRRDVYSAIDKLMNEQR